MQKIPLISFLVLRTSWLLLGQNKLSLRFLGKQETVVFKRSLGQRKIAGLGDERRGGD